jgi:hypothetical protein
MALEHATVAARLEDLTDTEAGQRVRKYVQSAHDADVTVTDLLTVLRMDEDLALEVRSNTGRDVIAAVTDRTGETRYAVWRHSAVAAKAGTAPRVRSVERRRDIKTALEGRNPLVRLREETPLDDLEAPDEWPHTPDAGEVFAGP